MIIVAIRGLIINDIIDILDINLIGIVPEDEEILVSASKGEPVVLNSKSLAGEGYRNITKRLTGENIRLMDLDESAFKRKIKKIFSKKQ